MKSLLLDTKLKSKSALQGKVAGVSIAPGDLG